jgi:hypothetical protein
MSLNLNGCSLFPQEFFPLDIHAKFRLNLECSGVIPSPLLLNLIGAEVIELLGERLQMFPGCQQFHL